jgi:GNAT superfamily N-acetyltransferase
MGAMREVPGIRFEGLRGERLLPWLDALAALRIEVFREWPYLYDGDPGYEVDYLRTYAASPRALCVLAFDGPVPVGAATAVPLADEPVELRDPFAAAGLDPASVFYFGESVLRASYRGRGIGARFMDARLAAARAHGSAWAAFCAVRRAVGDPRRPAGFRPLDAFWRSRGFEARPGLSTRFSWKETGAAAASPKDMDFWLKPLKNQALGRCRDGN